MNSSRSRKKHSTRETFPWPVHRLRDCAKYMVLSLPRPSEVPIKVTREKIVEDAFKNGTYVTLAVQLARFQEQDRRNNEAITCRPRVPIGMDDSYR